MSDQGEQPAETEQEEPFRFKPVKCIHRQPDHLPTYHANGGWGVINHHDEIRIGFYIENPPVPAYVVQPVNADGTASGRQHSAKSDDPGHFIVMRDFQCNITMPISTAKQIHGLLTHLIRAVEHQVEARPPEGT